MSSTVEQIKEKLGIEDVIASYIKLERAGKNLKAVCPFHNEKTPSFFVSPDRGTYYCFGCGAKGDVFTFVEEFEGLDFVGALKLLADRAGVQIEYAQGEPKSEKERLFKALEEATVWFEEGFANNKSAQDYAKQRGLREGTLSEFRVGFVPNDWRKLYEYLTGKDFTDAELLKVGLIKKGEKGRLYDTFRGRIMFPIFDASGRVIAFSGRTFVEPSEVSTEKEVEIPKYLNSPETTLFRKSETLYGYSKARGAMRKFDFCVLVEGQIDVLMSHQAGFRNTVAPLGTAVTDEHLRKIKRMTGNLLLALDADVAGVASARRGTESALALGFDVKVAQLPDGEDPADVILRDVDTWKQSIRGAKHIVDFLVNVLENIHKPEGSSEAERKFELEVRQMVFPYIARIDNKVDQGHFVKKIAEKLSVNETAVYEELGKVVSAGVTRHLAEDTEELAVQQLTERREAITQKLLGVLLWQKGLADGALDVDMLERRLLSILGVKSAKEILGDSSEEELVFEAETAFGDSSRLESYVGEMLSTLEEEYLREALALLMKDLKVAEGEKDAVRALEILKRCHEISVKIENAKRNVSNLAKAQ